MGSYATCYLGDFELGSTKNDVDPGLMSLFRDSDKVTLRNSNRQILPEGSFEAWLADWDGEDDDYSVSVVYRAPVEIVRDRLQVLGYSLDNCKAIFEESVRHEISDNEQLLAQRKGKHESDTLLDYYESKIRALRELTVDNWIDKMRMIREQKLRKEHSGWFDPHRRTTTDPVVEYMLQMDWYGYPGPDLNVGIRLALEACADAQEMIYDITDLIAGECYSSIDHLVEESVGVYEEEHRSASKIIILTEGKSDARILSDALSVLYPHLAGYYSFMQFDAVRYGGGAGNLVNILKAFAGAGVANRTIGLFDNDTAGAAALLGLQNLSMPSHIRLMKLPEIEFLKAYPTIGPSGLLPLDINGVAASIELYLGEDVLRESGELIPVQWIGYDSRLKRYQGEVINKVRIQRRFIAKIARAKCTTIRLGDPTWDALRKVFEMIFAAFDDFERDQIMEGIHRYYAQNA